jgi:hypothetical protein
MFSLPFTRMNIPQPQSQTLADPFIKVNAVGNRDFLANKNLKTGK